MLKLVKKSCCSVRWGSARWGCLPQGLVAGLCSACGRTARIVLFCASPRLAELSFPDGGTTRTGARNPGGIPDTQEQIPRPHNDPICPLGFLHLPHPTVEVYLKGEKRRSNSQWGKPCCKWAAAGRCRGNVHSGNVLPFKTKF